ncbi:MAG: LinF [Bacteroidales bacterium]|jgi:lincosamide nucleotidyltransferase|nr:LinF [Bacteroidales bacterium]
MLDQNYLIEKVRETALNDEKVSAVLMYGSFIRGEGDRFSDVEFYVFVRGDGELNKQKWIESIHPVDMYFTNEFGTDVVVFSNLIRGEFHFKPESEVVVVKEWEGLTSFEHKDKMNLVDKDGKLSDILENIRILSPVQDTPQNIEWLAQSLLNNLLFTKNVLQRKELAHAHHLFGYIQKYLLWLIRIRSSNIAHWESPTKKLEQDIPQNWYKFYMESVPIMNETSLKKSLIATFNNAQQLFQELNISENLSVLLHKITDDYIKSED